LLLPRLRRRWPTNYLLMAAIVTFATMLLVLAWVRLVPLAVHLEPIRLGPTWPILISAAFEQPSLERGAIQVFG